MNPDPAAGRDGRDRRFREIFEYVRRHFTEADGCHDFDHTLRVMRNAELLLKAAPEADKTAVRFAALLHDIGRVGETFCGKAPDHAEAGAKIAEKLLAEHGFEPQLAGRIVDAISRHRYRGNNPPETMEAKIVFDADKLDSLGAVGIGRSFLFAGRLGARLHNTEREALNSEAYTREDTCHREYLVKLRRLPERMFTEKGRELAAQRLDFMRKFFAELEREING